MLSPTQIAVTAGIVSFVAGHVILRSSRRALQRLLVSRGSEALDQFERIAWTSVDRIDLFDILYFMSVEEYRDDRRMRSIRRWMLAGILLFVVPPVLVVLWAASILGMELGE